MMDIVPFNTSHTASFLKSASVEGWITDQRELEFLRTTYPEGCLVALCNGHIAGFITALRYVTSAWIGNLLVLPDHRNKGIGRALIAQVLQSLDESGCETVWLTASAQGAHLYTSLDFIQIDTVQRWRGRASVRLEAAPWECTEKFIAIDTLGWGDSRPALYRHLLESRVVLSASDSFLACSSAGNYNCIGPWGAVSSEAAAHILTSAISYDSGAKDTFIDVPANNLSARDILRAQGFSVSGATLLMFRGKVPDYRAEFIYGLASMGSYG